ncbi:MAG TPA: S41 family peptidase [Pseudomonadales bacterium]|nr:S41 family peptidase [Pseudomonadales bacterium]
MAGAAPEPAAAGFWRSRGYGWVLAVDADGVRRYEIAGDRCFATPAAARGVTDTLSLRFAWFRPLGDDVVDFMLLPDDVPVRFDRLDALPPACGAPLRSAPGDVLEYWLALIGTHHAFLERRGIDWAARAAAARRDLAAVADDAALFDLLAATIEGLGDSHTKLIATIDGERRRQQDGQGTTLPMIRAGMGEGAWLGALFDQTLGEVLDPGGRQVANQRIIHGTLAGGRVGYVQVFVMGGFTDTPIDDPAFRAAELGALDAIMDEAMARFAGADAVILDLSNNRGGYDAVVRRLAGWFTDRPYLAYRTRVPVPGTPVLERWIEPAGANAWTGPLVLLTSDVTVSGGELAAVALRERPAGVLGIGTPTRGAFSTVLAKPLPNGWVAELSNEVLETAGGQVLEAVGVPVDRQAQPYPPAAPVAAHGRLLRELAAELARTP